MIKVAGSIPVSPTMTMKAVAKLGGGENIMIDDGSVLCKVPNTVYVTDVTGEEVELEAYILIPKTMAALDVPIVVRTKMSLEIDT